MAPGLASLVMYVGSTDTAIISAMTTHSPLPTTIGCSWGWTPADPTTLDPYFEKMAAQGQNFFAASGDNSTWSKRQRGLAGGRCQCRLRRRHRPDHRQARRRLEVGDRLGGQRRRHLAGQDRDPCVAEALGRDQLQQQGLDHLSQRPGCLGQCELHLLHLRRPDNLPGQRVRRHQLCRADVGRHSSRWSTSSWWPTAMPTSASSTRPSTPQNVTSSYATDFHDITSGKSGSYSAVTGYDLVTGWGSPKPALITTLAP